MKTVCKKLLCLMLVAMMLVSAIPAAFAEDDVETSASIDVPVNVYINGVNKSNYNKTLTIKEDGDTLYLTEATALGLLKDSTNRSLDYWESPNGTVTGHDLPYSWLAENYPDGGYYLNLYITETTETEPKETEPEETTQPTETEPETYTLVYVYLNANGVETRTTQTVENGDTVSLPTLPLVDGKDFIGWTDGDGNTITSATVWNIGESQTITANYETDTTEDGIVKLNVWAYYYVDGVYHHKVKLYTEQFESTKKNTMFTWLYSDGITQTQNYLAEQSGADGYQWANKIFYDYYDDGAVTEADMKSNANTSVYIKVYSKDEIESSVMLYVHTSKTSTVDRVIPMPGYTAGDYVSLSEVKTAVKTKYTGSNMTFSSLYTEEDWDDLLDGINSTGASSVKVETNGITKIHVIVKNATSTSSAADSSNPQTGDYITVAMTTMVLAAAALVSFVELKKRKMI